MIPEHSSGILECSYVHSTVYPSGTGYNEYIVQNVYIKHYDTNPDKRG